MGRKPEYHISSASVADYLKDIEARWGITLQFKITADPNPYSNGALIIELETRYQIHQDEVPAFCPSQAWLQDSAGALLIGKMWDMLLDTDRELVGGVFIE